MGALTNEQIVEKKMMDAIHVYLGLTIRNHQWELSTNSPLFNYVKELRSWFDSNPVEEFDKEYHWNTFIETVFAFESTFYETVNSISPFINKFTCKESETVFSHTFARKVHHLYPTVSDFRSIGHFWNVMAFMWVGELKSTDPLKICILDILDTAFEHWRDTVGQR